MTDKLMPFDFPTDSPSIIKVIGVGGGGGNAVKHMYEQSIHDVTFVLCNTDSQALKKSEIPIKVQLGKKTTGGLGAGNDPEVAKAAAEESEQDIRNLFTDGTQMAFITAGMGGGTGTGAAPVVAKIAKEMGILTVGIVTIPFLFERRKKILQAIDGVEEMRKNVDALLVINNERLREIYTDGITTLKEAFAKADDILTVATKSIAEIITVEGEINLDFRDVKKILKDGGVAIMSNGTARGERRLKTAIDNALHSPLLNDNDIYNAKKILFNISASDDAPILASETEELNNFMKSFDPNIEVIWGTSTDQSLGEDIKITILATGFGLSNIPNVGEKKPVKIRPEDRRIELEKNEKDAERVNGYYGKTNNTLKSGFQIFILNGSDIDNPDLIEMLESSPTYKRNYKMVQDIEDKRVNEEEIRNSDNSSIKEDGSIEF
jgi:cell division protein FtsZ